jgi:hypothetical protein
LRSAKRRTPRSFEVKPPSLKTGIGEGLLEAVDLGLALGVGRAEREEVVVVERETVGAELCELFDSVHGVEVGAGRPAEGISAVVPDGPQTD